MGVGPISSAPQDEQRNATKSIFSGIWAAKDVDSAGHTGAAQIVREADASSGNLIGVLIAELENSFKNLANSCCADRMAFRQKSAARVDWPVAPYCGPSRRGKNAAFASRNVAQVLGVNDLRDREAVM